ncbi:tripartite motif-containing protein 2-like isoform X2 [Oratosquilla oratoria]
MASPSLQAVSEGGGGTYTASTEEEEEADNHICSQEPGDRLPALQNANRRRTPSGPDGEEDGPEALPLQERTVLALDDPQLKESQVSCKTKKLISQDVENEENTSPSEEDRLSSATYSVSRPSSTPHPPTSVCPVHDSTRYRLSTAGTSDAPFSGSPRSMAAENQLMCCDICTAPYNNPKVLPCLHTFCEQCLISYTPAESLTLTCPVCRQQSILPKEGVSGLQSNTWVQGVMDSLGSAPSLTCGDCQGTTTSQCQECHTYLCSACAATHTQDSGSECHSLVSVQDVDLCNASNGFQEDSTTLYCPSHQGQTLRFYCRDCETAICSSCTDIEHCTHTTLRLSDAMEEQKFAMQQLIERVTMQLPCVKEGICDIQDIWRNLEEHRAEAEKEIRTCFESLNELLAKRQTALINTLNTVVSLKQKTLAEQKGELEAWVTGVESGCELMEKALNHSAAMEVVLVKKQLGERLMDLADVKLLPAPRENSHLKFSVGNIDPLRTALVHVGEIQSNSAVAHQTIATGESLKHVAAGRQSIVTVVTRDYHGEKADAGSADIKATIVRASSPKDPALGQSEVKEGIVCEPQVLDLHNGTYELAFTLPCEGMYHINILLYGTHIKGSPFKVVAVMEEDSASSDRGVPNPKLGRQTSHSTQITTRTSKASRASRRPLSHRSSCSRRTNPIEDDLVLKVGRRGRNRGEFVNPQGIAFSSIKDGRLAVADSNNQCVQVFTLSGECKLRFGVRGRNVGQLQRPTGVSVLPNGHYVVADYENKWVSIFEPSGKYVRRLGHGKLLGPKGVTVDNNGHIIVVDNKASCVCIFQQSGKLVTKFGNRGTDPYQFAGPHFVAVNSLGQIVVTDFHNHCVKVFNSEGDFLFTFGTSGEGNGQFNAPTGVAVDERDNIIVADWGNSRIQVFDSQGSFSSYVNTLADPLYGPQGLTLSPDGHVVVADSGNHCFKVYKYLED